MGQDRGQEKEPSLAKLNDIKIRALRPREKPYKVFDGRGLYIEVYPTGSKLWRLKYKREGRETRLSLGPWPEVPLAMVRDKIGKIRLDLREGKSPVTKKTRQHLFKDIAVEWFNKNYSTASKRPNTIKNVSQILNKHILPSFKNCNIENITSETIIDNFINKTENIISITSQGLSIISSILNYAILKNIIKYNSATNLNKLVPSKTTTHVPSLTNVNDFKSFLIALNKRPLTVWTIALKILVYVFVRPNELVEAKWSEINLTDKVWTISADRMKGKKTHIVPLSNQVIDLLNKLPKENDSVFFNVKNQNSIRKHSLLKLIESIGFKNKASLHGFRATASTLLNQQGYNSDWIERQLAHTAQGVRAVYNFADHMPERTRMMQDWADYVDKLTMAD
jgi:integrase